jgi:hypothetical protein
MRLIRLSLAILISTWLAAPGWSNQAAILQIRVTEGEGAVLPAGGRGARPIAVQVTDETGKPVEGAAVGFQLPDEGASGVFANGLRSELVLTDAEGRAAVRGMRWNRTSGPLQIRITASKGPARAGTIASAYVSDTVAARRSNRKWVVLGIAAGAAAGGVAYGLSRSDSGSSPQAAPPRIGVPVITIGAP